MDGWMDGSKNKGSNEGWMERGKMEWLGQKNKGKDVGRWMGGKVER